MQLQGMLQGMSTATGFQAESETWIQGRLNLFVTKLADNAKAGIC